MSIRRMARKLVQHVIEEPDTGLVVILAGAVQIDLDRDFGLGGLTADLCAAHGRNPFASGALIDGEGRAFPDRLSHSPQTVAGDCA